MSNISTNYQNTSNWGTQTTHIHQHRRTDSKDVSSANSNSKTNKNGVSDILDSLVGNGTISEEQEKSIKGAFQNSRKSLQSRLQSDTSDTTTSDPLDSLVSSGSISEEQQSSIKKAFESTMSSQGMPPPPPPPQSDSSESEDSDNSNPLKSVLDSLTSAGTIASDQQSSIISALESAFKNKNDTNFDSSDSSSSSTSATSGTSSTSSTSSTSGTKYNSDPLDSLVASGTITKEQQDAIKKAFDSSRPSHGMPPQPPPNNGNNYSTGTSNSSPISSALDSLTASGTITSEQESALKSAFDNALKSYDTNSFSYGNESTNSFYSAM